MLSCNESSSLIPPTPALPLKGGGREDRESVANLFVHAIALVGQVDRALDPPACHATMSPAMTMRAPPPHHAPALTAALCVLTAVLSGCAQGGVQSLLPSIGQTAPDTYKPGQPYQLSKDELALDCKKLTGRMQLRILQARDASVRGDSSALARTIQGTVTPFAGGATRGADRAKDAARDRAVLDAMNLQLASKNCATFDLDSELQPRSIRDTPAPVPKAGPEATKAKKPSAG